MSEHQGAIGYRFVSDYPFRGRPKHDLDAFEREALASLRAHVVPTIAQTSWNGLDSRVRVIAPVIMEPTCVACHNTNPNSPKRDWKVGDVRGIQELSVTEPIVSNLFSLKYLIAYFILSGMAGLAFIVLERRQAATIRNANEFLSRIATTISHYLSPQVYRSIFSGEKTGAIQTERKKLTIFFSDIVNFTSTTERMQPEELTALLNEYFTEMTRIALRHGGTVDKFVGDALLVFFGDPESRGAAEDAKACLLLAVEMQRRLAVLNNEWRMRGIAHPFTVRMGINTGYCNVGNFGSADRMDYTIIGAEANLASRLQSTAAPGTIVVSYETFALVRDIAEGRPQTPITMKGIRYEVVPYVIDGLLEADDERHVIKEHGSGIDLYIDLASVDSGEARRLRTVLAEAMRALDRLAPETEEHVGSSLL